MISTDSIRNVLDQYADHDWVLRRVLLTKDSIERFKSHRTAIFGDVDIEPAEIDALWFSRRSQPGLEAWEIRRLSASPYALVRVIPDEMGEAGRADVLRQAESLLAETTKTPERSH